MLHAIDDGESFSDKVVAQPQGYFDSMPLQSKIGFFSRSFTLLCIAHNHWDAENLDDVWGGYVVMSLLKWLALRISKRQ